MVSGVNRPADVVHAVEEAHEAIVETCEFVGTRDLDGSAFGEPGLTGDLARELDGSSANVKSPEAALRVGLGHQCGGVTVAAIPAEL